MFGRFGNCVAFLKPIELNIARWCTSSERASANRSFKHSALALAALANNDAAMRELLKGGAQKESRDKVRSFF